MPAQADPDLALRLAQAVADLYGTATEQLLRIVAGRLARGIESPGWAEAKLAEVTGLRNEARRVVEALQVAAPDVVQAAIEGGWEAGIRAAQADVTGTLTPRTNNAAVRRLVDETVTQLADAHTQILRSTVDMYRQVIAQASALPVSGAGTRRQAAQQAFDRLVDQGLTGFIDKQGRRWGLDTYTEMATRTATGRAQVAGTLDRFQADGRDLVIVSDAPQECKACRPWEGRVLSISGADPKYPSLQAAQRAGLLHANCRHRLGAYIPGVTKRLTDTADPEGDRLRREQRRLERGVRQWKQRAAAALDDDTRRQHERRARDWQARLREHVTANDLKRLPQRERLGAR